MNGYRCQIQQQYSYMSQCPYAYTCPMRNQCPVCPHRMEQYAPESPLSYGDTGANNGYCKQIYHEPNPYISGIFKEKEYGCDNIYPIENIYSGSSSKSPFYDSVNYVYIDPRENITSQWDNNRRFENNLANELYLPERPLG